MTAIPVSGTADIKSRLAALFGVQPGEGTPVTLLIILYFVISVSFVLVQTTAFGLFVDEFGSHDLPFAYLSVALLSSLIAFLYLKLSERVSFLTAQFANLAFLATMCVAFWIGLRSPVAHWFVFFLPFWFQTLTGLANLVVWHSAGHVFNVRQAKRLFGLVGAGNWLANVLGGFVVASVLALMGVANTYLLAAVALVLGVLILRSMVGIPGFVVQRAAAPPRAAPQPGRPAASVLRNPYTRLIFAYTLLWWIGFCFIDNIFFDRAGLEFPDGAMLASFLGRQLSVMGVIALITTAFLTSRIASKYGLRVGLLVMPVVVTASVGLLGLGGALGWSTAALFWIAAIAKTLNVALGFSLSQAMGSLLFQPLLGNQRGATQTIAEGIVQPVAIGIAGLLLLLFNTSLHFDAVSLSYVFIPIAVVWLLVIFRLSRQYPLMMSEALRKRALGETSTLLFDSAAREQLRKSLQHPRPGLALYALNQLEQLTPQTWPETLAQELPGLLEHPAPEVRAETLRRVLALRLSSGIPALRARLGVETERKTYSLLVQALASMRDAPSEAVVLDALGSTDRFVKRGAILGLLAGGGDEQSRRANEAIAGLVRSHDSNDRILAAEVLEECRCSGAGQHLIGLLNDTSLAVRHAAIRAAGAQPDAELLSHVLAACDNPGSARVAEEVLISRGPSTLRMISEAFNAVAAMPIPQERLRSMIRILGRIHEPQAVELLVSKMSLGDAQLRLQVFKSLGALGFRARPQHAVLELLNKEVAHAAWLSAAIVAVEGSGGGGPVALLGRALALAFVEARTRALLLLSFVYDSAAIMRAHVAMEAASAHQVAIALETIDALLPASIKPIVLPLLEAVSHERRLKDWRAAGLQVPQLSLHGALSTLIGGPAEARESPWTRLCAMDAAVKLGMKSCVPALQALPAATDPVTSRMSRWALSRLSPAMSDGGDGDMLSVVERVLILKSAPLFGETPDNVLADVAGLVEEVSFEKDQVVFNKGERGDSLYIIVSGGVQVWDGGRLLNELGEGDVFGELALLDPEPRAATVKAAESSRLLRLDEAHFREVLEARPEVSTAIIRVISRYLRSQLQVAQELNAKLRASESFGSLNPPVPEVP